MGGAVQILISGLSQGSIYALVGLGFSVAFMASRILNLAQGSYAVIGGFIFLTMVNGYRVPMPFAFLIVLAFSAAFGFATERIINFRGKPWRRVSLDMAVLSTLALLVMFEGAAFLLWGSDPRRGPSIEPGVVENPWRSSVLASDLDDGRGCSNFSRLADISETNMDWTRDARLR